MSINFSEVTAAPALQAADFGGAVEGSAVAVSTPQGMTLDLSKGATLDLTKNSPELNRVMLGASWDAVMAGPDADLDLSAHMLHENGKLASADDVIYFKHMKAPGIELNKDNRTGSGEGDRTGSGEGDDEKITITLSEIPANISAIVFAVNIYDGVVNKQTFGMIQNSGVRLVDLDNGDKEICRFSLKDDYASSTAVIFAKLFRDGGSWKFEAIGEGKVVNDLNGIVALYS